MLMNVPALVGARSAGTELIYRQGSTCIGSNVKNNPVGFVRSLKGAPASILLALIANNNNPIKARDLQTWTGYSDKSITQGLDILKAQGIVHKTIRGFAVMEGHQLVMLENRKIHDSLTTTTLASDVSSILSSSSSKEEIVDSTIITTMARLGIGETAAREIIGQARLTGDHRDYIEKKADQLKRRYGKQYTTGLLIHALKNDQPELERRKNRYDEGPFKEYIDN